MNGVQVGAELARFRFPVERGKVRELTRAIFEDDPVYRSAEAARAGGFTGSPAPLTFAVLADHWYDPAEMLKALGVDFAHVVHGEVRWEYGRVIHAGEELLAIKHLADVTRRAGRRGGDITFYEVETSFEGSDGEVAVRQVDTIIEYQPPDEG